jgi:HAE1 family hydrophobic/amphiphilic exporter-1
VLALKIKEKKMSMVKTSIQRPLMTIMAILAVAMFGLVAWRALPIDQMPNMELPYVMVQLVYPGAGPEEIEVNVVKLVEEQVSTLSGIKNMTSYCMENVAIIILEFNADIKADFAAIDVKDKIGQISRNLPDDLEDPIIMKIDINAQPIMTVALLGDESVSPIELRRYADKTLRDRFSQLPGVAQATVSGGRTREIMVTLISEKLLAHNLSVFSVYPALAAQNVLIPAGYVTGNLREYSVKFDGQFRSIEEIEQIQIPTPMGYNVRLNEIAAIRDGNADVRESARFQGRQSVEIAITKAGDANTVAVAQGANKMFERLKKDLPNGMELAMVVDQSVFIRDMVNDTYSNLLQGILLTAILLLIFLADFRLTIIAAVTMPLSLIMGFIGMDALGFTMNMVTMMSLTIVVGILVTNAIFVLENITRHRNLGKDPKIAALNGTEEIFAAVLASMLTNLAVFIPIANTSGITGSIFQQLGLTIVFATIASLILSFTLVPLMAAYMLKSKRVNKKQNIIERFIAKLERGYEKILFKILNNRLAKLAVVGGTILWLWLTMTVIAPLIGVDFMPSNDEGFIDISLEMPVGTPLNITEAALVAIEERVKDLPHIVAISTNIGGSRMSSGVENGTVRLEFTPISERDIDVFQIVRMIRPRIADIPDARITVASASSRPGGGGSDVEIKLLGNNMDSLIMFTERALEVIKTDPELTDFNSSWKGYKPEIVITPRREIMEHYGLQGGIAQSITGQVIGGLVRFNVTGDETAKFRDTDGEEYIIRVRLEENSRKDIRDIATMPVMTPKGAVPLEVLCTVEYSDGLSQITRINKVRMLDVTANLASPDIAAGTKAPQVLAMLKEKAPLPEGYEYTTGGMQDMVDETMTQLMIAAALAIILTLMLLIALLESIPMGLVIFLTLPMGLIGVIWALFLSGSSLSMISMMSIIMLIGVVSSNAILMIDYARRVRNEQKLPSVGAIVRAATTKLKALLMANIAIVVSMVPMALGMGAGGAFRAPFAITAIGGVIVSAVLTFFVIPVLYVWTAPKNPEEDFEKLPKDGRPSSRKTRIIHAVRRVFGK